MDEIKYYLFIALPSSEGERARALGEIIYFYKPDFNLDLASGVINVWQARDDIEANFPSRLEDFDNQLLNFCTSAGSAWTIGNGLASDNDVAFFKGNCLPFFEGLPCYYWILDVYEEQPCLETNHPTITSETLPGAVKDALMNP